MAQRITRGRSANQKRKPQKGRPVVESSCWKWAAILGVLVLIELPGFIPLESPFLIDFAFGSAAIYAVHYLVKLDHLLSMAIISLCAMSCTAHLFAFSVSFLSSDTMMLVGAKTHNSLQEKYHYLLWGILLLKVLTMAWGGRGIWQQHKRDVDRADRGLHHAGVIVVRANDPNTGSEAANC